MLLDKFDWLVNSKGYLIDKDDNIINRQGEIVINQKYINENGEIPKLFRDLLFKGEESDHSLADQLIQEVSGKFETRGDSKILPKPSKQDGTIKDKEGRLCNQDGFLMDWDGNIVDKKGWIVFPVSTLDFETKKAKWGQGTIPRIF